MALVDPDPITRARRILDGVPANVGYDVRSP
jgi:hypothetical protein